MVCVSSLTVQCNKNISSFYLLLLILTVSALGLIGYGSDISYYTSTQISSFLWLNELLSPLGAVWFNLTTLGDMLVLLPMLSLLLLFNVRAWAALFGAIPVSVVLSHLAKRAFEMPRPQAVIAQQDISLIGEQLMGHTSFPSGHTITIFATMIAVVCVLLRDKKIANCYRWCGLLLTIAVVIAVSRVAVAAHWPVDLLFGAVIGTFGGISGEWLTRRFNRWWAWMKNPQYSYIHIAILVLLSFFMLKEYGDLYISWISFVLVLFVVIRLMFFKGTHEFSSQFLFKSQ